MTTEYGKTFEWETFVIFVVFKPIAKIFPLNHLLCTVHDGHGLINRKIFPVNSVFSARPQKLSHSKVLNHKRSTLNSIVQISISRNMKYVQMTVFQNTVT